jgi:hypothetical protein
MVEFAYDLEDLNLDAMMLEDVALAANYLGDLTLYAEAKMRAMRCRLAGDITEALFEENVCEMIYARLPENWRW